MIWLYLLTPVVILGGIAIYLEKKSGSTPPDEKIQDEKLGEVINQNGINSNGSHDGSGY
ncbi:hypothetical protein [Peribacillus frigoritolerans]|uniref:hypothetical protein n=1 Tax=Peribacillus frigoritolerans TaxID=450367 RepID=UPI001404D664|nr:hypothetical protein [Peribacillus frigoritolerans]